MVDMTNFRKALSAAVRAKWASDEGWEARNQLKKLGYSKLHQCYAQCADKTDKSFRECLRECAQKANISEEYRKFWGTAGG